MAIQNPKDLFLYDLRAMYDVEQQLAQMLPTFTQECMDNSAREVFLAHEQETQQHIRNLEQCFQIMGSQPATLENHTASGLKQDHDAFLQQQPPVQALTLYDLRAGYQSECLEIAGYQNLIDEANSLGLKDCVQLFQQNMQQEVNASQKLASLAHQFALQQLQPVQNAVSPQIPNPPVANQSNYPQMTNSGQPNQPAPNPYSPAQNPPEPVSGQTYGNPYQPTAGQDAQSNPSPQRDLASQLEEGMQVAGSDMSNIGFVKQVRDNDFLVDIPMHRDLYVPFSAIQSVDADRVVLNVEGHLVNDMNWPKPSLL